MEVMSNVVAVAMYDFESADDEELSVKEGEKVILLKNLYEWIYVRNSEGREGYVPRNYVELEKNKIIGLIDSTKETNSQRVRYVLSLETKYPVDCICLSPTFLVMSTGGILSFIRRSSGECGLKERLIEKALYNQRILKIIFLREISQKEEFLVVVQDDTGYHHPEIGVVRIPKEGILVDKYDHLDTICSIRLVDGSLTFPICKIGERTVLTLKSKKHQIVGGVENRAVCLTEFSPTLTTVEFSNLEVTHGRFRENTILSVGFHDGKSTELVLTKTDRDTKLLFFDISDDFPFDDSLLEENVLKKKHFNPATHALDLKHSIERKDGLIHVCQTKDIAIILLHNLSTPGHFSIVDLEEKQVILKVTRKLLSFGYFLPLNENHILLRERPSEKEEEKEVVVVYDYMKDMIFDVVESSYAVSRSSYICGKEEYSGGGGAFCTQTVHTRLGLQTIRVDVLEEVRDFDDLKSERVDFFRNSTVVEDSDVVVCFSVCIVSSGFNVRFPKILVL